MTTRPAKHSTRRATATTHLKFKRDVLIRAFYRVLNDDPAFVARLAELHRRFPLRWPPDQDNRISAEVNDAVAAFVNDRPWLPRGARLDIWISLGLATERKTAPRLDHDETIFVTGAPTQRDAIAYDPLAESEQEFLARAKRHVEQTRAELKGKGLKPIHPKHKSETLLRREALRFYRRVLGWKYERIADEEERETAEYVDPETVRTSIRRWGRILGGVRQGAPTLRGSPSRHEGPMPMPCQFCRRLSMEPDAWCVTYSIDSDPDPVMALCERCATRIAGLMHERRDVEDKPVTS